MDTITIILLLLKSSIILSVFAIGLETTFLDMTFLLRSPGWLVRALLSMNVLMPSFALAIGMTFHLHPAVKIALVTIAVSPVPPIFPKKAPKTGGTGNYTIGLLVASAAIAIVAIPITIEIVEYISGIPLTVPATQVAVVVVTTIMAPLVVGIVVRSLAPAISNRVAKPIAVFSLALLVLSALPILISSAHAALSLIGNGTLLSFSTFILAGLAIGHLLGGPEPDNRPVLALASASRHPAVALTIAHANFPQEELAVSAVLLYLIVGGILSTIYLAWIKNRRAAAASVPDNPGGIQRTGNKK